MPIERDEYIELEKKKAHMKKAVLVELVGDIYMVNRDGYTLKKRKVIRLVRKDHRMSI